MQAKQLHEIHHRLADSEPPSVSKEKNVKKEKVGVDLYSPLEALKKRVPRA